MHSTEHEPSRTHWRRTSALVAGALAVAVGAGSFWYPTAARTEIMANTAASHPSAPASTTEEAPAASERTVQRPRPSGDAQQERVPSTTARDQRELSPEFARLLAKHGVIAPLDESGIEVHEDDVTGLAHGRATTANPRGPQLKDPSSTTVFDIDTFEQNIRDALDGETVGYSFAIGKAGKLHSQDGVGEARTSADGTPIAQSPTKTMTVASISKTVTAVVVLRLLEEKGISVDAPIGAWLPMTWERGAGVDEVTFRELMTHTSGLRQSYEKATGKGGKVTGSYDNIRIAVGQDIGDKSRRYANMNFSIFRIMVPKLLGYDFSALYDNPWLPSEHFDKLTGVIFQNHLHQVMSSIGVDAACESSDSAPTRLYRFPYNGESGWQTDSYLLGCGGYGFDMSANGLTSFLSHLRYTDTLLSAESRALMNDGLLGVNSYDGAHGSYLGHGGAWYKGKNGMRGCVMSFHIHVDATLLINSHGGDYPSPCTVLRDAFDAAWTQA